ncbi:MAG: glycosyltransferase [Rhizobiales bacterium]|nr:glycosyltransferase [Hyphomicrobiales bacterium]
MPIGHVSKKPYLSVVIRSKDEADRLKLTLASLECQTSDCEIIVVDDGSSDHTASVLADAARRLPLNVVRHDAAQGRSAASNAGARVARGEILLLLDGDTPAMPELLSKHMDAHQKERQLICRGDPHHLRCTRIFKDPDAGTAWPDRAEDLARRPAAELDRSRVTLTQVYEDFQAIHRRAEPGIYPGAGPRYLYEIETDALVNHPDCDVLWSASSGSNMSMRRDAFVDNGGFDELIDNNEHREMALRLTQHGHRMVPLMGAYSYHLTHRSGWRDPLKEADWEPVFLQAQPNPAVALLAVFWASISSTSRVPPEYRISSLLELAAAARGDTGLDYDIARQAIGFVPLGSDFWHQTASTSPKVARDAALPGGNPA